MGKLEVSDILVVLRGELQVLRCFLSGCMTGPAILRGPREKYTLAAYSDSFVFSGWI